MAEKSRSLSYFLFVCALLSGVIFYGCGGGGGTSSSSVPLQISGNVTSIIPIAGMRADSAISPDLRAAGNYAGVTVYLENYYDQHSTLSDADGKFLLSGVPAGNHYLVAIKKLATFTVKVRSSQAISVSDSQPAVQAATLALQSATASATGRLVDASGNGVPNARMTVWGEPFWTDSNGYYETWPMPANVTAPVIVAVPGYQPTEIEVKFTDNPPFIEQTIVSTSSTNRPPTCSLTASRYTVSPGVSVSLAATASDPDQELESANYSWSLVDNVGTFSGSLTGLQVSWRAPADNDVATITFTVTDNGGLKSQSSVQIVVGTGVKIPNDPPTVPVISCDIADPIYTGSTCKLTAVATDSNGDALTFRWKAEDGTIGEWGATTNWVTPSLSETATFTITVLANDGKGGQATGTRRFTINYIDNDPPYTPKITSPDNNMLFAPNATVNFVGIASDPQDGVLGGAAMNWYIAPDGGSESLIRDGSGKDNFNYILPSNPGTYSIRLQVTDAYNVSASTSIKLRINQSPNITILSPFSGSSSAIGAALSFTCAATDAEDGDISADAVWTFPAPIGVKTGNPINLPGGSFEEGANQPVKVTVEDSKGAWAATYTINLSIVNEGPTVNIANPADNSSVALGADVNITGSGLDNITKLALPAASMTWRLYDGKIPTYTLEVGSDDFIASFSETGIHVLTLTGSDQAGKTTSTSHRFTVNTNPIVTITSPASGTRFDSDAEIFFNATVTDTPGEEDYLTASWSSSLDGYLGTVPSGSDLSKTLTKHGSQVITCQGLNSRTGLSVSTETMILVNTLPVGTLTFDLTNWYASAPGDLPVFLSDNSEMVITMTMDTDDVEDGELPDAGINWYTPGNDIPFAQGKTVSQNLPLGMHTIIVRLSDSYFDRFPDQASATYTTTFYIWQSRMLDLKESTSGVVFMHGKGKDLEVASSSIQKMSYDPGHANPFFTLGVSVDIKNATAGIDLFSAVPYGSKYLVLGASATGNFMSSDSASESYRLQDGYGNDLLLNASCAVVCESDESMGYIAADNKLVKFNPADYSAIIASQAYEGVVEIIDSKQFSNLRRVRYLGGGSVVGEVFAPDTGNNRIIRFLDNSVSDPRVLSASAPIDVSLVTTNTNEAYVMSLRTEAVDTGRIQMYQVKSSGSAFQMEFGAGTSSGKGKLTKPSAIHCNGGDLLILENYSGSNYRIHMIRSGEPKWLSK